MIHFDFETFSTVSLKESGAYRYAEDLSTEVLCLAYAFDDEEPKLWTPYDDEPSDLLEALSCGEKYSGHNVNFEILIWNNVCTELYGWLDLDPNNAIDTAAMAAMHSLPRSLDGVCKALGVEQQKDAKGQRLINKLCKPRKPSKNNPATRWTPETAPEDFHDLYEYCKQDVRAEREVYHRLDKLPRREQRLWHLDRVINSRGITIDAEVLEGAIDIIKTVNADLEAEASEIAGGAFETTNQREKVMAYAEVKGYHLTEYTADYIKAVLQDDTCPQDVKRILEIRSQTSRTSTRKFLKMKKALCSDGTIKGTLLYHGAGTGRWAGRIIQPQNFPRPTKDMDEESIGIALDLIRERDHELLSLLFNGDPIGTMVSCIRGTLVPRKGRRFLCGDFSNIEGRLLFHAAGDTYGLSLYRKKLDSYIDMAVDIYNEPYESIYNEYKSGDDSKRRLGKLAILGLGYGMGPPKFIMTANSKGVKLSKNFAEHVVKVYREKFKQVTKFWTELERAAKRAFHNRGKVYSVGYITFIMRGDFLRMVLPSGRSIYYPFPEIREMKTPWGEVKPTLTYMVEEKKKWVRTKTFGGKLAENAIQGIARDLLVEAMFRLEENGYRTVLTVHDEVLSEREENSGDIDEFKHLMEELPAWLQDAPIVSDVWEGTRYRK